MRLTLISSPFEAFATSIFLDQLPHFSSTESLGNKQEDVPLKGNILYNHTRFFHFVPKGGRPGDRLIEKERGEVKESEVNTGTVSLSSREFLQVDHSVVRVPDNQRDVVVVWSRSPGQQLGLVLKVHFHHNLRRSTAVPRQLQNTEVTLKKNNEE